MFRLTQAHSPEGSGGWWTAPGMPKDENSQKLAWWSTDCTFPETVTPSMIKAREALQGMVCGCHLVATLGSAGCAWPGRASGCGGKSACSWSRQSTNCSKSLLRRPKDLQESNNLFMGRACRAGVKGTHVQRRSEASWFLECQPQMAPSTQHTHTSHCRPLASLPATHSLRSSGIQPGFLGLKCSA